MMPNDADRALFDTITEALERMKACVRAHRFYLTTGRTRAKNQAFVERYGMRHADVARLLLGITPYDFIEMPLSKDPGWEGCVLFVFAPEARLLPIQGEVEEIVSVYVKFWLDAQISGDLAVVVSMHLPDGPLGRRFRP